MAQHKSAKKRMRTNLERGIKNRENMRGLRTFLRKFREKKTEERAGASADLQSALDKAVKKGIIHRNKAGRLKSRLSH